MFPLAQAVEKSWVRFEHDASSLAGSPGLGEISSRQTVAHGIRFVLEVLASPSWLLAFRLRISEVYWREATSFLKQCDLGDRVQGQDSGGQSFSLL